MKLIVPQNTLLDDIAVEIGFTATCILVAWYGGRSVYVPTIASEDHVLAKLVGVHALRRLVAFCDETNTPKRVLCIPPGPLAYAARVRRELPVVELMLRDGATWEKVAADTGLSVRRVQQIVSSLRRVDAEILNLVRRQEIPGKTSREKPPRERPGGHPARKAVPVPALFQRKKGGKR